MSNIFDITVQVPESIADGVAEGDGLLEGVRHGSKKLPVLIVGGGRRSPDRSGRQTFGPQRLTSAYQTGPGPGQAMLPTGITRWFRSVSAIQILAVLKIIFNLFLGPPSPGGSRGRVRTAIFLRKLEVVSRFRPESGGGILFLFLFWP